MAHRIAVITPYYKETRDVLWQCHASVRDQQVDADHFMVADGFPLAELDTWNVRHVTLPAAHGDGGSFARGVGSLVARAADYDFIAYLDADNWYHSGHLRSLLAIADETGSGLCSAFRTFHDLAGEQLNVRERDEDELRHIDTSCLLIQRACFDLVGVWCDMPRVLGAIGDRVFLAAVRHRQRGVKSSGLRTVAFRTQYASHYTAADMPVPDGAKGADYAAAAVAFLQSPQGVSECVRSMGFWPASYFLAG